VGSDVIKSRDSTIPESTAAKQITYYGCKRLGMEYSKNIYKAKIILTLAKVAVIGYTSSGEEQLYGT
jgi:hypothetical protein